MKAWFFKFFLRERGPKSFEARVIYFILCYLCPIISIQCVGRWSSWRLREDPWSWTHINFTLTRKLVWPTPIILHANLPCTLVGLFSVAFQCSKGFLDLWRWASRWSCNTLSPPPSSLSPQQASVTLHKWFIIRVGVHDRSMFQFVHFELGSNIEYESKVHKGVNPKVLGLRS